MEEIEVGEYVRTKKKGIIGKIEQIGVSLFWLEDGSAFNIKEESYKHSKNIIDLLEVGDYVNGHLVVELSENVYNQKLVTTEVDGKDGAIRHHYLEKSIKSIVTHEQFESMEYKVKE